MGTNLYYYILFYYSDLAGFAPWGSGFPRPGDMVYSARYRGGAPVEHSRYAGFVCRAGVGSLGSMVYG